MTDLSSDHKEKEREKKGCGDINTNHQEEVFLYDAFI